MGALGNSDILKLKIGLVEPRLEKASHDFWSHPDFEALFPEYLFRLHCSVRASVPLMQAARERAAAIEDECSVAARLRPYLDEHISEELRHDEWLLDDMEVLGIDREETLRRLPPPEVAALIGSQYYWILHVHPVAVMSFLAVLEGSPPKIETLDGIVADHHIPRAALATFYKHSQLDISHGEEVFRLIDELPLSPDQSALLGLSAVKVVEHLSLTLEALLAAFDHGSNTKSAAFEV